MNTGSCRLLLAACLLGAGGLGAAEPGPKAKSAVRSEITRLVRQDAGPLPAPTESPPVQILADVPTDLVVTLEPMIIEERIPPMPVPLRENRVEEFFRTGVIAEHVGKKVTTRFWIKGDRGIMLSFWW